MRNLWIECFGRMFDAANVAYIVLVQTSLFVVSLA
jgi:hypothetical protein